jgi:hypothetical protein
VIQIGRRRNKGDKRNIPVVMMCSFSEMKYNNVIGIP